MAVNRNSYLHEEAIALPEKTIRIFKIDKKFMIEFGENINGKIHAEIILDLEDFKWLKSALLDEALCKSLNTKRNTLLILSNHFKNYAILSYFDENDQEIIFVLNSYEIKIFLEKHEKICMKIDELNIPG